MTREHRIMHIAAELEEAARCLKAARALSALDLHKDVLNRAYYAAYHGCLALLLTLGLEPKTHRGLVSLIGTELVRKGKIGPAIQHALARLSTYRELSDYDRDFVATRELALQELVSAERLLDDVRAHLAREGFLAPGA